MVKRLACLTKNRETDVQVPAWSCSFLESFLVSFLCSLPAFQNCSEGYSGAYCLEGGGGGDSKRHNRFLCISNLEIILLYYKDITSPPCLNVICDTEFWTHEDLIHRDFFPFKMEEVNHKEQTSVFMDLFAPDFWREPELTALLSRNCQKPLWFLPSRFWQCLERYDVISRLPKKWCHDIGLMAFVNFIFLLLSLWIVTCWHDGKCCFSCPSSEGWVSMRIRMAAHRVIQHQNWLQIIGSQLNLRNCNCVKVVKASNKVITIKSSEHLKVLYKC